MKKFKSKKNLVLLFLILTTMIVVSIFLMIHYQRKKQNDEKNENLIMAMNGYDGNRLIELEDKLNCYKDFNETFGFLSDTKDKNIYERTIENYHLKRNELKEQIVDEIQNTLNFETDNVTTDELSCHIMYLTTLIEMLQGSEFEELFDSAVKEAIVSSETKIAELEAEALYNELKEKINSNNLDLNSASKDALLENVGNLTAIAAEIQSANLNSDYTNELNGSAQELINSYNSKISSIEEQESIAEAERIRKEEESKKQAEAESIRKAEEESRKKAEKATQKETTTEKVINNTTETTIVKEEITTIIEEETDNPNAWKDSILDLKYNSDGTANLKDSIIGTPSGIGMETSIWRKEITNFIKKIDCEEFQTLLHSSNKYGISFGTRDCHHTGDTAYYDIRDFHFSIHDVDKWATEGYQDSCIACFYVTDDWQVVRYKDDIPD